MPVDIPFLRQFEQGLDPLHPEQSRIPAQVLGYGEISTVFTVAAGDAALAYQTYAAVPKRSRSGRLRGFV
ncbi:MAG: hypothetical protein M5U34_43255 [Chloroflexi bacterium]|nr:hypothetical protein [Chloroflexota bacterium]